jgi:hypothetical protein
MLFKIIKRLFNNINKSPKYTCSCCGYKTLMDNGIGEVCLVCYWEEDYTSDDDIFDYSSANKITLYEAQENYKIFGACHKRVELHCRKPCKKYIKDVDWIPSQARIEKLYKDNLNSWHEAQSIIDKLSFHNAKEIYTNFKSLPELMINFGSSRATHEDEVCAVYEDEIYKSRLQLKALSIYLVKIDAARLIDLVISNYKNNINYYIGWSIILIVILSEIPPIINDGLNDLLIELEANDFYGLASVRNSVVKYWLYQKNHFGQIDHELQKQDNDQSIR